MGQKILDIQLAKGTILRGPYINIPDEIQHVMDKSYYGSFFGINRPLNALEAGHIYYNIQIKQVFATLFLGYSQVAKDNKIKKFLSRGNEINREQAKILGDFLQTEHLPVPESCEFQVTSSKHSPFSDKLLLFHSTVITAFSMLSDSFGMTSSVRKDVIVAFGRLMAEILEYSKDGTDLMIDHGWLERVPETANRTELVQ